MAKGYRRNHYGRHYPYSRKGKREKTETQRRCPVCGATTIARISAGVWGEPLTDEYGDSVTVDRCLVCGHEKVVKE